MNPRFFVSAVILLACIVPAAGANPEAPPDPAARAREILNHPWYQNSLPAVGAGNPDVAPPAASRPPTRRRPLPDDDDDAIRIHSTPELRIIRTVLIGLGVVFIIGYILRHAAGAWPEILERRRNRLAPAAPNSGGTDGPFSGDVSADAEALAGAGRYSEAIHALLQRVFGFLMKRERTIDPAMTGREILKNTSLNGGAKQALGELVQAVEISRFGGRPATERDFQASRQAYQRLRDAGSAS